MRLGRVRPERRGRERGRQARETQAERRSRGAERSRAGERDRVTGYLRSGTGSLSEPKSVLSLNNTRWPTRPHARHVTACSFRHAPCSALAPPPLPPSFSSLPRHPSFPQPPSLLSRARPCPSPGCQAGGGRGRGRAQAPTGPLAGAPCLPLS